MTTTVQDERPQLKDGPSRELAPRWAAGLAGLCGAGVALAAGELFDGMSESVPSLVVAVGNTVIDNAGGETTALAIDLFGENDKPALVVGIVAFSLLIGTAVGLGGQSRRWLPRLVFLAFGLAGGWVAASDAQSGAVGSWFAALTAAALGWLTYEVLLHCPVYVQGALVHDAGRDIGTSLLREGPPPSFDRRVFVGGVAGAGAIAAIGVGFGRWLRARSNVAAARAEVAELLPVPASVVPSLASTGANLEGVSPFITPNSQFYRIDTAIVVPQVDPTSWSMSVTGMVDNPLEFTLDDLLQEELVERTVTIACVSNSVGGDLVGNAVWTGVPLDRILERAGVQPGAEQLVAKSVDGWSAGFPTSVVDGERSALVAVAMNGEPLPVSHGFPARLIVAGLYGYVSATKWLQTLELNTWDGFDGFWIPRGWSKEGPVKLTSRIDTPRRGSNTDAGHIGIGGVAWETTRGISAVEVRINGEGWTPAQLHPMGTDETWVQWTLDWDAPRGSHVLEVRAYDGEGAMQPEGPVPLKPDGAEGWHRITVSAN
jgi:DMSO/TMAO reductase YedYZ molybdopterin-dependent catalytic subunit